VTPFEVAVGALIVVGVFFTVVSAVGVLRLPDLYTRAHSASKSETLGVGLCLIAVAMVFGPGVPAVKTVFLLVFMFITSPTAAHAIARAAADQGIEPWTADGGEGEE
jgi:multicomponent Na+:H+ antiporter subunit G